MGYILGNKNTNKNFKKERKLNCWWTINLNQHEEDKGLFKQNIGLQTQTTQTRYRDIDKALSKSKQIKTYFIGAFKILSCQFDFSNVFVSAI